LPKRKHKKRQHFIFLGVIFIPSKIYKFKFSTFTTLICLIVFYFALKNNFVALQNVQHRLDSPYPLSCSSIYVVKPYSIITRWTAMQLKFV